MPGPFDIFDRAFAPMTEPVVWTQHNEPHHRGTIPAVVLETGDDDPVDGEHIASDRRMFAVHISESDWPFDFRPSVGDTVRIPSLRDTEADVAAVTFSARIWNLTCRERRSAR